MKRVVHLKKAPFDVRIDRLSKFGNPFTHIADKKTLASVVVKDRDTAISYYRRWLEEGTPFLVSIGIEFGSELHVELIQRREIILSSIAMGELKGKVLGCWCAPLSCHGDVLVELSDAL